MPDKTIQPLPRNVLDGLGGYQYSLPAYERLTDVSHMPFIQDRMMRAVTAPFSLPNFGIGQINPSLLQPRTIAPMGLPSAATPEQPSGLAEGIGGSALLSLLKNGNTLKNLYDKIFPPQPGTPSNTAGDQALQSDVRNSQAEISNQANAGNAADLAINTAGIGALSNYLGQIPSVGGSTVTQLDPSTLQPIADQPTYQQPASQVPSAAGSAGAGLGVGLGSIPSAPAGTVIVSEGTPAITGLGGTPVATSTPTAASGGAAGASAINALGPAATAAMALYILNEGWGDQAYGGHSVTLGQPLSGQYNLPLQSGQAALGAGNIAYGGGNDASQGSGQWFLVDANKNPTWLGADDTKALNSAAQVIGARLSSGQDIYGDTPVSDAQLAQMGMSRQGYNEMLNSAGMYSGMTGGGQGQEIADLQRIYDKYGGQNGWGTSFDNWANQIAGIYGNASGHPSGG